MGVEDAAQSFIAADPILGGIIVILGAVVVYLSRARDKERDARLQESKEVRGLIVEPIRELANLIVKSNDDVLNAIDDIGTDKPAPRRRRQSR